MRTYTIAEGDTLSEIALRECGSAALASQIWLVNWPVLTEEQTKRGVKPLERDLVFPGTVINVPERVQPRKARAAPPAPDVADDWLQCLSHACTNLDNEQDVTIKAGDLRRLVLRVEAALLDERDRMAEDANSPTVPESTEKEAQKPRKTAKNR